MSRDDQWRLGWVLGIGAEAALGRNWTARIEAFHYDLDSATYINASGNRTISVDANVVRAGRQLPLLSQPWPDGMTGRNFARIDLGVKYYRQNCRRCSKNTSRFRQL